MVRQTYFPDRGDFVHMNFSPAAEHEIADRHYALVLSTRSFSKATGFALVCPVTSNIKPWPFDVRVPKGILPPKKGRETESVTMTDQIKSIDFRDRECEYVCKAPDGILDEVLAKVRAIIDSDDVVAEVNE
ncbi:MAG TPA: type II toxin-antitoxin system PemK/MazF family toxin [Phycisphaerae bacterium]|nr:type II toxin-antitoxin system PemK/MazF family toxin [Phycisphaerae bacterium]